MNDFFPPHRLITAAKEGHKNDVLKCLQGMDTADSDVRKNISSAFRMVARQGDVSIAKLLLPYADPQELSSAALRQAASLGHEEMVLFLVPLSDVSAFGFEVLEHTARQGMTESVKAILAAPNAPQTLPDNTALVEAMAGHHWEIAFLLMPHMNPQNSEALDEAAYQNRLDLIKLILDTYPTLIVDKSKALISAAAGGFQEIVNVLKDVIDSKQSSSEALWRAAHFGHLNVVETLMPLSDTSVWREQQWANLEEHCKTYIKAQVERKTLQQTLAQAETSSGKLRL